MGMQAGVKSVAELRQFSAKLNQAADACSVLFQNLNNDTHRICESWEDEKATKFMQTFEVSHRNVEKIAQEMKEFSAYITRLAERVEDYTNQR
ncbi:MAG: WXG100 family type VII secretion target [Bacteroidaceae bacterium]|nr:WXG100 family type VII secretion target [Bacteroidaceae bacterium]